MEVFLISLNSEEFRKCINYIESDDNFYKTVSEISVSNKKEAPSKTNSCIYNNDIRMS